MTTLAAAAQAVGLDFGFAWQNNARDGSGAYYTGITPEQLIRMNDIVLGEGSIVSPGDDMSWAKIQPTQGAFSWTSIDELVGWALAYDKRFVQAGHIVYHLNLPSWVTSITNPTTLRTVLEDHVTANVSHFETQIMQWNVVNEVIAGFESTPNYYRQSHWYNVLGESYVKYAFDAAASVATSEQSLIWNDNGAVETAGPTWFDNQKAQLVRWLDEGVRIDGWGTQLHLNEAVNASAAVMVDRLNQIAELGLDIYITELDVTDTPYTGTAESIKQQCADYLLSRLGPICADVPALKHVVSWSPTDTVSWLNDFLGPRGDGIPRTGNPYDRQDPAQPNPMRQAIIDSFGQRDLANPTGNVANALTNDRATITVATPSTAIEVRFGTDVLVDHNGLALTSPGVLADEASATLDDQSSVALLDNEVNSLTGQTTTGSESVTLTLTGGT
jgi:endo-1,4-beta-xylanase